MWMANAQFSAEGQRFETHALSVELVGLPGSTINDLLAVRRPREVGDVPLRLKHVLFAQRGYIGEDDGIVGPIAVNFDSPSKGSLTLYSTLGCPR